MRPAKERGVIIMNPHRTQRNNLVKCPKCSMSLFNEELSVHECLGDKKIVDIMYMKPMVNTMYMTAEMGISGLSTNQIATTR